LVANVISKFGYIVTNLKNFPACLCACQQSVKKMEKMSINVIQDDDRLCYDIYDSFTMEHFRLRQKMTLTTKIYCSRLYVRQCVD
jgi:hypothetical protein